MSCKSELSVRERDFSLGAAERHPLALLCQIIKPTSVCFSALRREDRRAGAVWVQRVMLKILAGQGGTGKADMKDDAQEMSWNSANLGNLL